MSTTSGGPGTSGTDALDPAREDEAHDAGALPDHSARAVLRYPAFRRLWLVLGLSSFGDWLGLLAVTFFAAVLAGGGSTGAGDLLDLGEVDLTSPAAGLAVSAVFVLRLAPAVVLGPLAGVLADRVDRRVSLVVGDVVRGLLFLSIPLVAELWWLFVATVLVEVAALFWMPAKDAMVPTLVPRRRLEAANQLGVVATYGTAPLAALAFVLLVWLSNALDGVDGFARAVGSPVDLALYVNAATFLVAAVVIARLPLPPRARGAALHRAALPRAGDDGAGEAHRDATATTHDGMPGGGPAHASVWRQVWDGWTFIARTPVVRGLVGGMIGAFAAGGVVIGLGIPYVATLGAGAPGYGVLFGAVFVGMALGVWQGPRTLRDVSRRRLFASSIAAAGLVLVVVGLSPDIVLSVLAVTVLGFFAGLAWVTGMTLLGAEVDDTVRGRTFAFVQTAVRIVLVAVMAAGPALASLVAERQVTVTDSLTWTFSGPGIVFALAGVLAVVVGTVTFRQLDDRPDLSLRRELVDAVRRGAGDPFEVERPHPGFFIVVEGGDGSGKSTLTQGLVGVLTDELGHDVVLTREPGGTALGVQLRRLVLDRDATGGGPAPVPRAEALLFAADRAQHVATVVRPALEAGKVVVGDRYVDSSIAYQGARGDLDPAEVARLSQWATDGLRADLTVVLDVDPAVARARLHGRDGVDGGDRLETAGDAFHAHVRRAFLDRASLDPRRYLVVDAGQDPEEVLVQVARRLRRSVPLSARHRAVMAERLASDARRREQREARAIEEATAEAVERERVAVALAAERQRREQEERDRLATEAERMRARAAELRRQLHEGETEVLPAVPASGAEGWGTGSAEAYAPDGYARDGYATDGYATDGYATDGYGTDGYATDGYGTDGYGTDGYGTDGYGTDGYAADGYAADGPDAGTQPWRPTWDDGTRPDEGVPEGGEAGAGDVAATRPHVIRLTDEADEPERRGRGR